MSTASLDRKKLSCNSKREAQAFQGALACVQQALPFESSCTETARCPKSLDKSTYSMSYTYRPTNGSIQAHRSHALGAYAYISLSACSAWKCFKPRSSQSFSLDSMASHGPEALLALGELCHQEALLSSIAASQLPLKKL